MRELTYYVAVSLDGKIAAPDHTFDAFPVEGDHIETILRDYVDTVPGPGLTALGLTPDLQRFDTVLMGWQWCGASKANPRAAASGCAVAGSSPQRRSSGERLPEPRPRCC